MIRPLIVLSTAALALAACQRSEEAPADAPAAGDIASDASATTDGAGAGAGDATVGARSAEAATAGAPGVPPPPPATPDREGMTSQLPVEPAPGTPPGDAARREPRTTHELARPDTPMPQTDPDGRPSL